MLLLLLLLCRSRPGHKARDSSWAQTFPLRFCQAALENHLFSKLWGNTSDNTWLARRSLAHHDCRGDLWSPCSWCSLELNSQWPPISPSWNMSSRKLHVKQCTMVLSDSICMLYVNLVQVVCILKVNYWILSAKCYTLGKAKSQNSTMEVRLCVCVPTTLLLCLTRGVSGEAL